MRILSAKKLTMALLLLGLTTAACGKKSEVLSPQATPPSKAQDTDKTQPPAEPKFSSIKKNIFEVHCVDCHTAGGIAEKVSLESAQDLINSARDLVLPGKPDESGLVIAIERQDSKRMPPPRTGAPLNSDEIAAIRKWILDGAKDD